MKILIVEDEKVAALGLEKMIREILGKKITSLKIQNSFTASECFIMDNPIDLLFLDLNLNGEDGFELLKHLVSGSFQTIIVSANHEQAIRAFEYGVLDFVPKPVSRERLKSAVNRFEHLSDSSSGNQTKYISIRKDELLYLIKVGDIVYFQGQDNYINILLKDGRTEKTRKTLDSLLKILPVKFMRIHKSYIVNIEFVKHLHTLDGTKCEAVLQGNVSVPVSRNKYKELKNLL